MEVAYLRKFQKDLLPLPTLTKEQVKKAILSCKEAYTVWDIPSIKKLKGHSSAYRIRIGDYRIGVYVENSTIEFVRVVHRKDIYKFFP